MTTLKCIGSLIRQSVRRVRECMLCVCLDTSLYSSAATTSSSPCSTLFFFCLFVCFFLRYCVVRRVQAYFQAAVDAQEVSVRMLRLIGLAIECCRSNYTAFGYRKVVIRYICDALTDGTAAEKGITWDAVAAGTCLKAIAKERAEEGAEAVQQQAGEGNEGQAVPDTRPLADVCPLTEELVLAAEVRYIRIQSALSRKNYQVWDYMRWLVTVTGQVQQELAFLDRVLKEDDNKNFHAWAYRYVRHGVSR